MSHNVGQIGDVVWRLCINYDASGDNWVSIDEYVPKGAGAYIEILSAIIDVYMPVIVASRGLPFWKHSAGGERYVAFDSWAQLLNDERRWKA